MVHNAWTWMVGTRYLRSTHRRGFVSFVAFMSTAGLMLGVAVLIVVLSVMNGFERELRSRILSVTSHATLIGLEGTLSDWQDVRSLALKSSGVRHAVPYVEAQAMIANGSRVLGSAVRGIDPELEREAMVLRSTFAIRASKISRQGRGRSSSVRHSRVNSASRGVTSSSSSSRRGVRRPKAWSHGCVE